MEPKTILPADTYYVINRSILTDFERETIITLYEPIIGPIAVSLYFTLWQDEERLKNTGNKFNHHHLMTSLKLGLEPVTEARRALESFGLLRSYYKAGDINDYVYEIFSPLAPYEFFNHPIFNVVLYNNIGSAEYDKLVEYYKKQTSIPKDYCEVTSSLETNFKSISMSNFMTEIEVPKTEAPGPNIDQNYIDFDLLISSLPKDLINEKAFNKRTRSLINSLSFVYDLDTLKMSELLRMVINENGVIDKDTLRIKARKYYQFNNNGSLPTLIYRTQPEHLKAPEGDASNRGKMIYIFENTSPYDFLRSKYHGAEPTSRDLKLLEYLAIDLELKPSVINVLIDYVLKSNNNKLTQNYVETIAGQWKRMNIETADKAMRTAEKEHKKNKTKVFVNTKTSNKEVKTPIWFNEKQEVEAISEEDKQELEKMLKEFRWCNEYN